jgi:hypothetical protein
MGGVGALVGVILCRVMSATMWADEGVSVSLALGHRGGRAHDSGCTGESLGAR